MLNKTNKMKLLNRQGIKFPCKTKGNLNKRILFKNNLNKMRKLNKKNKNKKKRNKLMKMKRNQKDILQQLSSGVKIHSYLYKLTKIYKI